MIVDLIPSEDQQMILDSFGGFLADQLPISRLREDGAHGGAAERAAWQELSGFGLFGLGLSDELGGLGLGLAEEALIARSLGRELISPSLLAQLIAPHLARDETLRAALVSGETRAALAQSSGHALDVEEADWLVCLTGTGAALIPKGDVVLEDAGTGLDETVTLHRISTSPADAQADDRASLLVAAYVTGIAQVATEMAVEYAKTREQFGQPIGAFQAIKHMCADMVTRAAAADAQISYAAVTFAAVASPAGDVAAARMLAADAALANARANIQIHGGMGFTAECDAHLLLKRAQLMARFGTSAARLRADVLG